MKKRVLAAVAVMGLFGAAGAQPGPYTADQDRQAMMDLTGVKQLRHPPSSNDKAPDSANYDESKANPWPLPDLFRMKDGRRATTPALWQRRRAEIKEDFDREVLGRVPANAPRITWKVLWTDHEMLGRVPVTVRQLVGQADNAAAPDISVNIQMTLVLPSLAKGPVPLLMMFTRADAPAPSQPTTEEGDRINAALRAAIVQADPSLAPVLAAHPAWNVVPRTPAFHVPQLNADGDLPNDYQLAAAGWGFARMDPGSIQADNGAGLTRGIIGLANKGKQRKPEDWGALRAWAWGASRGLDYLATLPEVDSRHIGIEGVSRNGKAALIAGAYDERFSLILVGSSGEGGAKPYRRNFGEAVEDMTGISQYHWMAGNFLKYGGDNHNAGDIPVDAHELIALCAPRLTFISYGAPDKGDTRWLDHQGSFMAAVAAQPVWRMLGAKTLGGSGRIVGDDYKTEKKPDINVALLDGDLAWRQHDGGHTDAPNMKYFIAWANGKIGHALPPSPPR